MTRARSGILTRDFLLLLGATIGALSNYAPLLSVVPLWVASGGVSGAGIGATTGIMMGATALTQLAMAPLFRLLTLRQMLAAGALVMAVSTPGYALSTALPPVLVVSAVRGVGFAMVVVAGAALVAELVPGRLLARGTGIYGLAAGLPNLLSLPAGVWLAQEVGFVPVFLGTTVLALAAVPLAWGMSGGRRHIERAPATADGRATVADDRPATPAGGRADRPARAAGRRGGLRPLLPPALVFFGTTVALGGAMTFLPLAIPQAATASLALFALSGGMISGRFAAGTVGDALGAGRLLVPAAVVSAAGMAVLAGAGWAAAPGWAAIGGATLFGLGLGAVQNDSLVLILNRAGPGGHGTASAVWNFAYDAGTGAGAVLLGVVVGAAGHPWAFATAAALILLAAPAGRRAQVRPAP
ncbi:MFS transporter [Georgenia sp. 10Sc9-8]|uniref:MFS transporter n=1 Tax=Georgenia halotolerans TaxID=3028317 RepID=A0ABT5TWF9_9MICO|nr:MFS transporter [Georgenia halotolerans]